MPHTQGPWRIGDAGYTVFGAPNGNPAPKVIATLRKAKPPCTVDDLDESIANTNLIVASPELLEALEQMVKVLEMWPGEKNPEFMPEMKAARNAIKKAKGV